MAGSIQRNAIIALIVGSLIGSVAGIWTAKAAWRSSVDELQRDALLATDKLELLVRNIRLGVEAVAARLDPTDLAGSAGKAWPAIEGENLGLRAILVLDSTGTAVAASREESPTVGMNYADRAYFQAIFSGDAADYYISAPIATRPTGEWVLPMSVPIIGPEGFSGVVVGAVDDTYFETINWTMIDPEAQIFLYLEQVDAVVDAMRPATTPPLSSVIEDHFRSGSADDAPADLVRLSKGETTAFVTSSASGRFHVAVGRDTRELISGAAKKGGAIGLGLAAIVGGLLMLGLQWRAVAQQRAADARQIERDARIIEADARRIERDAKLREEDSVRLRLLEERLRLATDAAEIGVWDLDLETGRLVWDDTMHRLYGTSVKEFRDDFASWRDLVHPDDIGAYEAKLRSAIDTGSEYEDLFRIVRPDGEERVLRARAIVKTGACGKSARAIGVNFDVTEQVAREQDLQDAHARIRYDALHDPLTDLGNRRALNTDLSELVQSFPTETPIAFLHLDLDRFKYVNDLFGHAAGDHLLTAVANILRRTASVSDRLYRLGGDEFAVVITEGNVAEWGSEVADLIVAACRQPVLYEDKELLFGCSVGICVDTLSEASNLIDNADIALYVAKNAGRNQSALFTPELRRQAEYKKRLADSLTAAMAADRITMRLQPQIWAETRTLAGVEALARWQHEDLGELLPSCFLPIAEELGILNEIDNIILVKTVAAVRRLASNGLVLPKVSVNASHRRIMQRDLLDRIEALGPMPCKLAFELLETIDFDDFSDEMTARLREIRARGIEIEVDDFGSGRTSITTLLRVQPDRVKIDRQLVTADILSGRRAKSVLRAITEMAEAIDIPVTAEGVETEEQARRAADLGCDILQGFLFSKPLTEAELLTWARKQSVIPAAQSWSM